ncbi:MAG: 3-phosphoshikimate 1-carboxyvinyltransferase [Candidatus Bathyarchaeia archaeon]
MSDLIIKGGAVLSGSVKAPPSKAHTHRAIIAASLSNGLSKIHNPLICDDTLATINACRMLGAEIKKIDGLIEILGRPKPETPSDVINCGESGSTIRFITPICALADGISVLTGSESLRRRPMAPLLEALNQLGVKCYSTRMNGYPPIVVFGGGIKGGEVSIRGDISSQFISGLLFATPMAENDTYIVLSTPLESKPYVDITLDFLNRHGIKADFSKNVFHVYSGQKYRPCDHFIEGDFSSAAFLLAAASITNSHIRVENLLKDSLQGDKIIVKVLSEAGAHIRIGDDFVEVNGAEEQLNPINVDMRDNPDLVPVCAALACFSRDRSVIRGVRRLRYKESDRIMALLSEFRKMGADITFTDDCLIIDGGRDLHGAEIDPYGDHRIAMACALLALNAGGETIIHDAKCINKSYPDFVRDMRLLGAEILERQFNR